MYVQENNDATLWLVAGTLYHQIKKYEKEFKDNKGINRSRKLKKGRKYNGQKNWKKGQIMIYR